MSRDGLPTHFLRELAKKLPGWTFKKGHHGVKIYNPEGRFVTSASASRMKSNDERNLIGDLRRGGAAL